MSERDGPLLVPRTAEGPAMAARAPLALFEMRRMEALSTTICGVAMTLLAYQVPRVQFKTADPKWGDILLNYGSQLSALMLSFIVAGTYWYSQHRRLAYSPLGNRLEVIVNLLFLMMIVVLPVTTGLYGNYVNSADVTAFYGFNLALISLFDALLWGIAVAPRRDWMAMVPPAFANLILVSGAILALFEPTWPRYVWPLAFAAPLLASSLDRWKQRRGKPAA